MRIATYNVEWFNTLFDDSGALLDDDESSGRYAVTRGAQLAALGIVFTAFDADAVLVVEAPDTGRHRTTVRALRNFAAHMGLRARQAVIGFANQTQQELALLYDPDVIEARHDPRASSGAPRFDGVFRIDLDVDAQRDQVRFSKPPLELVLRTRSGFGARLIGTHLKSKYPHGAATRDEAMRGAIANRRKQLAQALWLRARVDDHLSAGEPLVLLGDLNDGPGLDSFEELFGRSSVEIVMGEGGPAELRLFDPHARRALTHPLAAQHSTARFYMPDEERYLQALLDYIMISPQLVEYDTKWRIWHPFDDPGCFGVPELREALLVASDHFPVSLDLALPS
ncbi:MAG: endonuclease/exonuclease/phosphatase family protein [Pseudomonadota bacterium]